MGDVAGATADGGVLGLLEEDSDVDFREVCGRRLGAKVELVDLARVRVRARAKAGVRVEARVRVRVGARVKVCHDVIDLPREIGRRRA